MSISQSDSNDVKLAERIRSGDKKAFEQLYRTYFSRLCDFAYRYLRKPAVCEGLIQDLFLNIWIRRTEWEPKGSVRSYLFKAARNRVLDHIKHKRIERDYLEDQKMERERQDFQDEQNILHLYGEQAENEELIQAVQEAIDQLPERRKLIFTLSREEGLTYKEIAKVLDISIKTVETQMGRSLNTLRELLSGHLPGLVFIVECVRNLV